MKKPRHHITDHALLRYFERIEGIDVEACRRDLGRRVDAAAAEHEGLSAVILDGQRFVIEGKAVVTVTVDVRKRRSATSRRSGGA